VIRDLYGQEFGDWEDPVVHLTVTLCTGCTLCIPWEGRSYEAIRADRIAQVAAWRAELRG
jgi:hypothetical protein